MSFTLPIIDLKDYEFDKEIDLDISTTINFDTNIDFDTDVDIDVDINSDPCIDGNVSMLTVDAEAIGYDTYVQVDASVLSVEHELSSVTLSVVSAVG